jgi:hypothetical protein
MPLFLVFILIFVCTVHGVVSQWDIFLYMLTMKSSMELFVVEVRSSMLFKAVDKLLVLL